MRLTGRRMEAGAEIPALFLRRMSPRALAAITCSSPGLGFDDTGMPHDAPVRVKPKHSSHKHAGASTHASATATAESSSRKLSDSYALGRVLGQGSFGQVFSASRLADRKSVAVKIMAKSALKTPEDRELILNEAALMERVKGGPHVLELHEFFEDADSFYMVVSRCEGGDVMARLASRRALSEADVARYCSQMLRALQWCHARGVCHRDLKPENFLLTTAGGDADVMLADFGLAKGIHGPGNIMRDGCGSPAYMAPEIFSGAFTVAIDAWSLGVSLFVMLTAALPFGSRARTAPELFAAIQRDPIGWTESSSTLSLAVRQLLVDLLEKDPARRLGIDAALARDWVSGGAAVDVPLDRRLLGGLASFASHNRFRRHAVQLVAAGFSPAEITSLGDHFRRINADGSGHITRAQLVEAVRGVGGGSVSAEALADLVRQSVDTDHDGRISWPEFLEAATEQVIQRTQMDLRWVFRSYDADGDGRITLAELRGILKGEPAASVQACLREYDVDGDGTISYDEFVRMLQPADTLPIA